MLWSRYECVHMWAHMHPLLGMESRAMNTFTIELHSYPWQLAIKMTKPLSLNLHYITILPFNCTFLNTSHICKLVSWTVSVFILLSAHAALERGFFLWNEWDYILQWSAHRARWLNTLWKHLSFVQWGQCSSYSVSDHLSLYWNHQYLIFKWL